MLRQPTRGKREARWAERSGFVKFGVSDYFALFFSASIRSLAAGPDEAGFWPVISWPSATV